MGTTLRCCSRVSRHTRDLAFAGIWGISGVAMALSMYFRLLAIGGTTKALDGTLSNLETSRRSIVVPTSDVSSQMIPLVTDGLSS